MPVTAHQRVADLKHPGACRKHQQLLRCWRIRLVPFAGRRAVRHMMLPLTLTYVRGEQRRTTVRRSARIKGSKQGPCPKQGSRRSCPSGPWSSRVQLCCSTESGYYLLRCVSFRLRASLRAVQAQPTQPGRDAARSWSFAIARSAEFATRCAADAGCAQPTAPAVTTRGTRNPGVEV